MGSTSRSSKEADQSTETNHGNGRESTSGSVERSPYSPGNPSNCPRMLVRERSLGYQSAERSRPGSFGKNVRQREGKSQRFRRANTARVCCDGIPKDHGEVPKMASRSPASQPQPVLFQERVQKYFDS